MPDSHSTRNDYPELDHLQAGLLMLMDQYAETPCKGVAMAVTLQIEKLLGHPLIDLLPELQRQCSRGLGRWRARTVCASPWQAISSRATH